MASTGYQNIYHTLRDRIVNGEYAPEAALPSESLLCTEFNTSRPTVRRALNLLIDEALIVRQPGVGSFVAPRPDRTVQPVIGIDMGGKSQSPFYFKLLVEGVKQSCLLHNAQLRILGREECANIPPDEISGIISATARECDFPALRDQARRGIPVVLVNRIAADYPELSSVAVDYVADSSWIVGQAIDRGLKKVAIITHNNPGRQVYSLRSEGWKAAYVSRRLPVPADLVFDDPNLNSDIDAIRDFLLDKRPDAVFSTTGEFMNRLLMAAVKSNLRIPEDIKIICFDDLSEYENWSSMPVCFVRMPLYKMGEIAVRHIVQFPTRRRTIREILPSSFIFSSAGSMF